MASKVLVRLTVLAAFDDDDLVVAVALVLHASYIYYIGSLCGQIIVEFKGLAHLLLELGFFGEVVLLGCSGALVLFRPFLLEVALCLVLADLELRLHALVTAHFGLLFLLASRFVELEFVGLEQTELLVQLLLLAALLLCHLQFFLAISQHALQFLEAMGKHLLAQFLLPTLQLTIITAFYLNIP